MRKKGRMLPLAIVALLGLTDEQPWPKWTAKLTDKLRCGMTIQEIEAFVVYKLTTEEVLYPFVGRHRVSREPVQVWLQFGPDTRLRSFVLQRPERVKWIERSPRHNLCTGDRESELVIRLASATLLGARIFIDQHEKGRLKDIQESYEIAGPTHTLRLVADGYPPLSRRLQLSKGRVLFELSVAEDRKRLVLKEIRPGLSEF